MKYDFSKVPIINIEGEKQEENMSELLANSLYYTANDISLSELGRSMHKNKGTVDVNKEVKPKLVAHISVSNMFSAIGKKYLLDFLTDKKTENAPEVAKE